jgi:hypothetical protein
VEQHCSHRRGGGRGDRAGEERDAVAARERRCLAFPVREERAGPGRCEAGEHGQPCALSRRRFADVPGVRHSRCLDSPIGRSAPADRAGGKAAGGRRPPLEGYLGSVRFAQAEHRHNTGRMAERSLDKFDDRAVPEAGAFLLGGALLCGHLCFTMGLLLLY